MPRKNSIPARDAYFAPHVDRSGACWLWTRPLDPDGYGHAWDPVDRRATKAHQLAYVLASGEPIPTGMQVCHTCDTPSCTRNDESGVYVIDGIKRPRWGHLWLGTSAENTADKMNKGRHVVQHGADHHHARWCREDIETMVRWYGRGLATSDEIARLFGTRREEVTRMARGDHWAHLGLTPIRKCAPYTKHKRLRPEERKSVATYLVESGATQAEAAAHFGISKSLVSLIAIEYRQ